MVKSYSTGLCERVVTAVIAVDITRVVADRFGVAVSSVVKYHQRFRKTGTVEPGKMGGYRKHILEPYRDLIVDQINRTPHLTVRGLKAVLVKCNIVVSHHTVWIFLRREGLSFKKSLLATEQLRH